MTGYRIVGGANRRRDQRIAIPPIEVEIAGVVYRTQDWSLGGFKVEPFQGVSWRGAKLTLEIIVAANELEYRHEAAANVVRYISENRQLAARFVSLSPELTELLDAHMSGRLRRQHGLRGVKASR